MAYIYCDACGVGFHSNVLSCPECGRRARVTYHADSRPGRHRWRGRQLVLREDVESAVRESIYGWRSGTVELCGEEARANASLPSLEQV